jgi:predicted DNA-binding transcriptional regulator AlpA
LGIDADAFGVRDIKKYVRIEPHPSFTDDIHQTVIGRFDMQVEGEAAPSRDELSMTDARQRVSDELRVSTQQRLSSKFAITSEFVRVPVLAKVLSVSANSIYAQMRNGSFPIPHRRVGNVVLVKFFDLVDWYCRDDPKPTTMPCSEYGPQTEHAADAMPPEDNSVAIIERLFKRAETPKERANRIKKEVAEIMSKRRQ